MQPSISTLCKALCLLVLFSTQPLLAKPNMDSDLKKLAQTYFQTFAKKDLTTLSGMFDDYIELKDWDIHEKGKENVLKANQNIFKAVKSISVEVTQIYQDQNTIIAELTLVIDEKANQPLYVLDIITFNENKKIVSIGAYKR